MRNDKVENGWIYSLYDFSTDDKFSIELIKAITKEM